MTPAEKLIAALTEVLQQTSASASATVTVTATASIGWTPERFWTCADPVRLSADELAAALGCSARTVYRLVAEKGMPARKRDDVLVFIAGDVRAWLQDREEIVNRFTAKVTPLRARRTA